MQQIIFVVFIFAEALSIRQPTCPNDLMPKLDKSGRPLQCIPGSSSRLVCGKDHSCFFSGVNYMCCPSNEPASTNHVMCPAYSLTVLDPSGLPLKCETWTHACPRSTMMCMLIGRDYICCERLSSAGTSTTTEEKRKKVERNPKERECPIKSIGLLDSSGFPITCSARKRCPARAYCHSFGERSVCCGSYEFASSETSQNTRGSTAVESSLEILKQTTATGTGNEPQGISHSMTTEPSDRYEDYPRNSIQVNESTDKKSVKPTNSHPAAVPVREIEIQQRLSTAKVEAKPNPAPSSIFFPPSRILSTIDQVRRKQESVSLGRIAKIQSEIAPVLPEVETEVPSANSPSQLFSGQDKRLMAEQFLIHQIRNGWPYDEKFYRSDVDAFTPQQRRRMSQIFFADTQ